MALPSCFRVLLSEAIDYAGLFPPAALSVEAALAEYAQARASDEAWALGRFVAPVRRLDDVLRGLATGSARRPRAPWPLALTFGDAWADELPYAIEGSRRAVEYGVAVEAAEFAVAERDELQERLSQTTGFPLRFAELALTASLESCLATLAAERNAGAKFRTGGVVASAFPDADLLLWGISTALRYGVPFKCTAGLHHPVSGTYRLTYAAESGVARMYGYVNLMAAVAALTEGHPVDVARRILLDEDPGAIRPDGAVLRWREVAFSPAALAAVRTRALHRFGSCSFREPIGELAALAQ